MGGNSTPRFRRFSRAKTKVACTRVYTGRYTYNTNTPFAEWPAQYHYYFLLFTAAHISAFHIVHGRVGNAFITSYKTRGAFFIFFNTYIVRAFCVFCPHRHRYYCPYTPFIRALHLSAAPPSPALPPRPEGIAQPNRYNKRGCVCIRFAYIIIPDRKRRWWRRRQWWCRWGRMRRWRRRSTSLRLVLTTGPDARECNYFNRCWRWRQRGGSEKTFTTVKMYSLCFGKNTRTYTHNGSCCVTLLPPTSSR